MSIFANKEVRSALKSLSKESMHRSIGELCESIRNSCPDSPELPVILDRIFPHNGIDSNIDGIIGDIGRTGTVTINTNIGRPTHVIFPFMHAIYRYDMKIKDFAKAIYDYAHSPNTVGGSNKTILISTDTFSPDFMDMIEDSLADVYFTGKLAVFIVLFTDYSCSDIPFYMNFRWSGAYPNLMSISDVIAYLGIPIIFEKYDLRTNYSNKSRSYSIIISDKDAKIINNITGRTKTVNDYPEYDFLDYDYFPRGRVVYNLNKEQCILYLDHKIRSQEYIDKIKSVFGFDDSFVFGEDEHYQSQQPIEDIDPEELERDCNY